MLFELHPKRDQIDQAANVQLRCSKSHSFFHVVSWIYDFNILCVSGYKYGAQAARLILPKWQHQQKPQSPLLLLQSQKYLKMTQKIVVSNRSEFSNFVRLLDTLQYIE